MAALGAAAKDRKCGEKWKMVKSKRENLSRYLKNGDRYAILTIVKIFWTDINVKKLCSIFILFLLLACIGLGAVACEGKKKYPLQSCAQSVVNEKKKTYDAYGLKEQKVNYTNFYPLANGAECYFDERLSVEESYQSIEKMEKIFQVTEGDFAARFTTIYFLQDSVTYFLEGKLWINAEDCAEQILAVMLAEMDGQAYPFGIYAGQAAYLLKRNSVGSISLYKEEKLNRLLGQRAYCKDLQYPLYVKEYVDEEEFVLAWTFSYTLVDGLYTLYGRNCFSEKLAEVDEYIAANSNAESLGYKMAMNDSHYPIEGETKNVIYYFCDEFDDVVLEEEQFSLSYLHLRTLLTSTEEFISSTRAEFGKAGKLPNKITVYFGQDLLTMFDGHGGQTLAVSYAEGNLIICRSLAVLAHEIVHQLLYLEETRAYFTEEVCDLFSTDTLWGKYYSFAVYSGAYEMEAEYEHFDGVLTRARALYDKNAGKGSMDEFNPVLWRECLAQAMNERESNFKLNCQTNSFVAYIYTHYGMDALDGLRTSLSTTIEGKTFADLVAEWRSFLQAELDNRG